MSARLDKILLFGVISVLSGAAVSVYSGRSARVIAGWDAKPGDFPWQISIQRRYENGSWFDSCGGTLVDRKHVLSAAHCVDLFGSHPTPSDWPRRHRIVLGAWNITDESEPSREAITPCRFHIHPDFNITAKVVDMDVVVITLSKPVQISEFIQPLRLAPADANPEGSICVISGWGFTAMDLDDPHKNYAVILQAANQTIISKNECAEKFEPNHPRNKTVVESDICSKDPNGGESSICNSDSGGPLVCFDLKGPYWAGIISSGGCHVPKDRQVSLAIRVSKILDFINCKQRRRG